MTEFSGFSAADLDAYARRAVTRITLLARRASRFATVILLFTVVASGGGFLLGLEAFGRDRAGWWVIGGVFAALAIGCALVGRWRVGSVRRHVPALVDEVRSLLGEGRQAAGSVIDTLVVVDEQGNERFEATVNSAGAFGLGRTLWGYKGLVGSGTQTFARLTATMTALTTFPVLALSAVLISLVFIGLSVIFAIVIVL